MNINTRNYQKKVAQVSILSGITALASFFFLAAGTAFHFEVFSAPQKMLGMNDADAQYLKWSMILDMFGYYLLLLPALFYFKNFLKNNTAWHELISWCGSAYIFLGAMGAAILSIVCPQMMVEYPIATAAEQVVLAGNFKLVLQIVHGGMWNTLEILLAGTWWLGIGYTMRRNQPAFAIMTMVLGLACLMDGFGTIAGLADLAEIGLNIYLNLAIVWAIWFGIGLLKKKPSAKITRKMALSSTAQDRNYWSLVN